MPCAVSQAIERAAATIFFALAPALCQKNAVSLAKCRSMSALLESKASRASGTVQTSHDSSESSKRRAHAPDRRRAARQFLNSQLGVWGCNLT